MPALLDAVLNAIIIFPFFPAATTAPSASAVHSPGSIACRSRNSAEVGMVSEPSGMTATARIKAEFVIKNGSEYLLHKDSFLKMS